MPRISENIKKLYRVGPHSGRGEFLRLDMNENPVGLPKFFFDKVIKKITPELVAMYPEPKKLISSLSGYLEVTEDCIAITNGSDDAIKTIFSVFGTPNSSVVGVNPTFAMYNVYAEMYGLKTKFIEYKDDFTVSIDEILNQITEEVSIVALVNPNNPIGTVYTLDEAKMVINKAKSVDAVVILDEAYYYFYDQTLLQLVKQYDNVILTRTFSKLCSIAGLRVGYCVSNPTIIRYITNAMPTYSVNTIALEFANELIQDNEIIPFLINQEREGRAYLVEKLKETKYEFKAQHGNFIFIKPKTNKENVERQLLSHKILIKTYSNGFLKEYIRISTADITTMKLFWDRFKECDL